MFEPKVYTKNGLEAFRLLGSDGSEFFYEGALDCNEQEIYRDEQGRLYYPVITDIGGAVHYFVELQINFPLIPFDDLGEREKAISKLINASPRAGPQLPDDVFVKHDSGTGNAGEAPPAEPAQPLNILPAVGPDQEKAGAESGIPQDKDVVIKPVEKIKVAEPQKGEPPVPPQPPKKKKKKSPSLVIPVVIVVIIVLLLIAAVAGAYMVKPGLFSGLKPGSNSPTPTPEPTVQPTQEQTAAPTDVPTATAEPTQAPTPEPTAPPLAGFSPAELTSVQPYIDSDNATLKSFFTSHLTFESANNKVRQVYDLYMYTNKYWTDSDGTSPEMYASNLTTTLKGDSKDYSVLMCALAESNGVDARIVAYDSGNEIDYYPEVLVANDSTNYTQATDNLRDWYGMQQPYGHSDSHGYWISLYPGSVPGLQVADTVEYAIYPTGSPEKIK